MSLLDALRAAAARPDVAFFHSFQPAPYGGSNQFLTALRGELRRRGLRVSASLIGPSTRAALLNAFAFDAERLRRRRRPACRVVHRVDGPVGRYRGTDDTVDRQIVALNAELADSTVFQSMYSLRAHEEQGLALRGPVVIPNAVDPALFHARGRVAWDPGRKVRLIATSWSDNANKGAATYAWMERHLDWTRFEFTFVGRSPVRFERIRTLPPLASSALADVLRAHDIYVTASRHDPASNALTEALACGLPALFAKSGGHPEIVGEAGLAFADDAEVPDQLARLVQEFEARQSLIAIPALADVADRYLAEMGLGARPAS